MKEIPLTQGKIALVDDEDFERVNQFKWQAYKGRKCNSWYAIGCHTEKFENMHRLIMGLNHGDPQEVDHIDMNGLNNQRANLRLVTRSQNKCNSKTQRNNNTGFKGVSFYKRDQLYRARIKIHGKETHLGYFKTAEDAAAAYDKASREIHKEYGRTNGLEAKYDANTRIKLPETKGYYFNKYAKKWQAYLPTKDGNKYIGVYDTELEAAEAYRLAAKAA